MTEPCGGALVPECHDPKGFIEAGRLGPLGGFWIATHATFLLCLPPGLPSTLHGPNSTPGMKFSSKEEI